MLAPDLRDTVAMLVEAIRNAKDPWWVISSAAVALHAAVPIAVGDVDVISSMGNARRLVDGLGIVPIEDGASARFRSMLLARWKTPPLVEEIMAGFHVATDAGWTEVLPRTRVSIMVQGGVFMCLTGWNWPRCSGCSVARRIWSESGF